MVNAIIIALISHGFIKPPKTVYAADEKRIIIEKILKIGFACFVSEILSHRILGALLVKVSAFAEDTIPPVRRGNRAVDQLYRICGIAKRSALYLVQHEIIPAIDTGKKTWRYKIALEDVIIYLRKRDQVGSMIPCGCASSRRNQPKQPRRTFASIIQQGEKKLIADYFSFIYADYPDMLTTLDLVEMTGYSKKTILQLLKSGQIKALLTGGKYKIPKQCLLDYVKTRHFIETRCSSENFIKILGGFEIWKSAKL